MEKAIRIGNKEVTFKATAGTPIRYRRMFGNDIMVELMHQNVDEFQNFEALENLAYVMAGGKNTGMEIEDWLDQFELTAFYTALEEILGLWNESQTMTVETTGKNTVATGR